MIREFIKQLILGIVDAIKSIGREQKTTKPKKGPGLGTGYGRKVK